MRVDQVDAGGQIAVERVGGHHAVTAIGLERNAADHPGAWAMRGVVAGELHHALLVCAVSDLRI
ncbi:hypothetical protein [Methylobacterium crusticola]|uniref:hypothetical protein n=1 Tax=Methylobacterium crusticola TaxID=1697972 RepID=UPI000FFBC47F|nr:hypothetical protein [Methylobacterium crusticola]